VKRGGGGEQEKVEGRGSQMIWGSWDMQRAGMPTGGTVPTSKVPKYLTSSKFLAPISIIFYLERVIFEMVTACYRQARPSNFREAKGGRRVKTQC
jgi:hypothetical protein